MTQEYSSARLDTRNLVDTLKGMTEREVIDKLDRNGVDLEVAIENLDRDFSMGTIVRTANAFGVRHLHVIGRKQWNKRGAMATDKYLHVHYYTTTEAFIASMNSADKYVIAVDIVSGASPLSQELLPSNAVLVFGSEGQGISEQLLDKARKIVYIPQSGSTRSINVAVAAGIAMWEWTKQNETSVNNRSTSHRGGAAERCIE